MERWPQLRAGMISLAIVLGLIDGCPLPRPGHVPEWQRSFVEPLRRAQRAVLLPLAPAYRWLHIGQRWALYQAPRRERLRFVVEGRDASEWRVLFRAGDAEYQDDADVIDYTRPRGTWDATGGIPQQYRAFADWVIQRELARHPELSVIRVKLERVALSPDGTIATIGEPIEVRARNRERGLPRPGPDAAPMGGGAP